MITNCSGCGKEINRKPWEIKKNKNNFCSKECFAKSRSRNRFETTLSKISWEIKNRRADREFDLSAKDIQEQWEKQNGLCALTGTKLQLGKTNSDRSENASLDRKNSSIGYVRDNIHWVRKDVNMMKQSYNLIHYINTCLEVANHYCKQFCGFSIGRHIFFKQKEDK